MHAASEKANPPRDDRLRCSEQLAGAHEALAAQAAGLERARAQKHSRGIAVRVASDLTENPVHAASMRQYDRRPQLRRRQV